MVAIIHIIIKFSNMKNNVNPTKTLQPKKIIYLNPNKLIRLISNHDNNCKVKPNNRNNFSIYITSKDLNLCNSSSSSNNHMG